MFETKTFSVIETPYIALAELSKISNSTLQDLTPFTDPDEVWYYFNRLNVPAKMRNKGFAKQLLQQVVDWADQEQVNIWLDINPYGDLNLEQLVSLYWKYGFTIIKEPNCMIRRYNVL